MTRRLRTICLIVALLACARTGLAQSSAPREALDRVDPVVLLTDGKDVDGRADLQVRRGDFIYFFSTPATKAAFEKTPEKFEIQLGGACARMGPSAGGNASDFLVYEGRIYIFGSDECHKKFAEAPQKYLAKPAAPLAASKTAVEQGQALVARAVSAVGGAARIDAAATLVEKASRVEKRAQGEATVATTTVWRFPGDVRSTRTAKMADRTMTGATLVTSAGAWYIAGNGTAYPVRTDGRPDTERPFRRAIVPLLRARRDTGFNAAALPRTTIDGTAVDRVRIVNGIVDVTLAIDPATGRIHSLSYVDRNNEGEIGEFTIVYGDYRTVDGLTLPFSEAGRFNGAPDESLRRTVESIAVNPPVDASMFEAKSGQ